MLLLSAKKEKQYRQPFPPCSHIYRKLPFVFYPVFLFLPSLKKKWLLERLLDFILTSLSSPSPSSSQLTLVSTLTSIKLCAILHRSQKPHRASRHFRCGAAKLRCALSVRYTVLRFTMRKNAKQISNFSVAYRLNWDFGGIGYKWNILLKLTHILILFKIWVYISLLEINYILWLIFLSDSANLSIHLSMKAMSKLDLQDCLCV